MVCLLRRVDSQSRLGLICYFIYFLFLFSEIVFRVGWIRKESNEQANGQRILLKGRITSGGRLLRGRQCNVTLTSQLQQTLNAF